MRQPPPFYLKFLTLPIPRLANMKFFTSVITAISAATIASAQCTAEQRINVMKGITAAFNKKGLLESAAAIQAMPLQRDCPAIV